MQIIAIILEKFLTLSFILMVQLLVSWKFGAVSYASLLLTITIFSSLSILNVNSDLSFAKRSHYDEESIETYDLFAIYRSLLVMLSAVLVLFFMDQNVNLTWVLFVLFQQICDSLASNRIIYNNLTHKVSRNIISALYRLALVSVLYMLHISISKFLFCVCCINLSWVFLVYYLSPLQGFRIKSILLVERHSQVVAAFKEDIVHFHIIGYLTLLINRFDIIVFGHLSEPNKIFALIGAISMATNTLALVFASVMPLNLKTAKNNENSILNLTQFSQYLWFSSVAITILSLLLIGTSDIWLSIILPTIEHINYDYLPILVISLLNVFVVRVFIQTLMSFLIIKHSPTSILRRIVFPPLILGAFFLVILIPMKSDYGLDLFLTLGLIKLAISILWLYLAFSVSKREAG